MVASDTSQAGPNGAATASTMNASAPRRIWRETMSDLPWLGLGEQAVGTEDEDEGHHGIDYEQLDLRGEMHRRGPAQSDDQRADQRAIDRAEPAGHHHREGEHDHLDPDA